MEHAMRTVLTLGSGKAAVGSAEHAQVHEMSFHQGRPFRSTPGNNSPFPSPP